MCSASWCALSDRVRPGSDIHSVPRLDSAASVDHRKQSVEGANSARVHRSNLMSADDWNRALC
ncbi:protein of unknown function (plasmid) [Pararobbsia alpina]